MTAKQIRKLKSALNTRIPAPKMKSEKEARSKYRQKIDMLKNQIRMAEIDLDAARALNYPGDAISVAYDRILGMEREMAMCIRSVHALGNK